MTNPAPFIIPAERVDEAKLQALAGLMASATGAQVDIRRQFVVSSDSPACLLALETLFGDPTPRVPSLPAPEEKPRKKYKPRASKLIGSTGGGFILGPGGGRIVDAESHSSESLQVVEGRTPLKLNPAPHHEIRAWHVIVAGEETEIITISEKDRRLAAGAFATGTELRHPRAGLQRVTGEQGQPQGMEPAE